MTSPLRINAQGGREAYRWVLLHYTTLIGELREVVVSSDNFEEAYKKGFGKLDGSNVEGFRDIGKSDLILKPDLRTMARDPFRPATYRVISDVYEPDGVTRFSRDPRFVSERAEQFIESQGLRALVGVEIEFYVLDGLRVWKRPLSSGYELVSTESTDGGAGGPGLLFKRGYHVDPSLDRTFEVRREVSELLDEYFGIKVEAHHHEVSALGQVEVNVEARGPLAAADSVMTVKYVSKMTCARKGRIALFLAKLTEVDNGSGMHIHVSLWRGDRNLFDDPDDPLGISQTARYFIGGLLYHARALSAIVSPTVNSYKRLVPGFEAPVYLVWGVGNRSAAVRIPAYWRASGKGARIEYRPPDPTANPYLAIPAVILAGLDGIRKKLDPGEPFEGNAYSLDEAARRRLSIRELPRTLVEALEELRSDSDFLKPVFDEDLVETYIEVKRREWRRVATEVTPAEIMYYSSL